jgi:hypothetical protein
VEPVSDTEFTSAPLDSSTRTTLKERTTFRNISFGGKKPWKRTEGVFLDEVGSKNLKNFAPCYSQSPGPPLTDFTPPYGFLGLEIATATAESGRGLCLHYLFV